MKFIQSVLTIIMAVLLIGMMPNLVNAKSKTKTIKILPTDMVPVRAGINDDITPAYVSSANTFSCKYYFQIQMPEDARKIMAITYYHRGWNAEPWTSVMLYRCKMGNNIFGVGGASSIDNTGNSVPVTDAIDSTVEKGWTYYIRVYVPHNDMGVEGIKIKYTTK